MTCIRVGSLVRYGSLALLHTETLPQNSDVDVCSLMRSHHLVDKPKPCYEQHMYLGRVLASPTPMCWCCIGVFHRSSN